MRQFQFPNELISWQIGVTILATPFLLFPTVVRLSAWVCIILCCAAWIVEYIQSNNKPIIPRSPITPSIIVICVFVLLGVVVSADPNLSFSKFTNIFLAFAWWRLLTVNVTRRLLPFYVGFFLAFSLLITTMGVLTVNWADKVPFVQVLIEQLPNQLIRLPGSAASGVSGNQLAGTILLFWPLSLALISHWRNQSAVMITVAALIAFGLGVLLLATQSRAGWLGAIICLGSFILLHLGAKQPKRIPIIGFILFILLSGVIVTGSRIGFDTFTQLLAAPPPVTVIGNLGTVSFRLEVWQWAIVAINDFPFTGTGLGTFRTVAYRLYPIALPTTYDFAHAHNVFLQIALDVGLIGLTAYIAMLLNAGLMSVWLITRNDWLQKALGHSFLTSLIGFHTYGLGDTLALGSKTYIIFWMFLGIITGVFVNCRENKIVFSHPN